MKDGTACRSRPATQARPTPASPSAARVHSRLSRAPLLPLFCMVAMVLLGALGFRGHTPRGSLLDARPFLHVRQARAQPVEAEERHTVQRRVLIEAQLASSNTLASGAEALRTKAHAAAVAALSSGPCATYAGELAPGARHVRIASAAELLPAVNAARPGDVLELKDGLYEGSFTISEQKAASGRADAPITLCGSPRAVLRGPSQHQSQTAVLLLAGVAHWHVAGLTIENGYKAIWGKGVRHCLFEGLTLRKLGQDGIRLSLNSTSNTIRGCAVQDVGQWPGVAGGEGIYIGSAEGQWATVDGSSHNSIIGNSIGPGVAAECVDIKEGTEGTLVEGNFCDGSGLHGSNFAASLFNIKGSRSTIRGNVGVNAPGPKGHGITTVVHQGGWGDHNVFENNTLDIKTGGYGIRISRKGLAGRGNVVRCSNRAPSAGSGLSNVPCTP